MGPDTASPKVMLLAIFITFMLALVILFGTLACGADPKPKPVGFVHLGQDVYEAIYAIPSFEIESGNSYVSRIVYAQKSTRSPVIGIYFESEGD